jgi:hypothetical protein
MAHDPSKYNCCFCKKRKIIKQDGIEVSSYCKIDRKSIEFWGIDKCPLLEEIEPLVVDEINNIKDVSERNGICPHCGRNISFGCSTDTCYWCRKPIIWNK